MPALQKMSGQARPRETDFPARDLAAFQALPQPARRTLVAIVDLAEGGAYAGGQAALAKATGRVLRSVERAVSVLLRTGFVRERRRGPGRPALLLVHPSAAVFVAAERLAQLRRPSQGGAAPTLALVPASMALAVASVRRAGGSLFVPAPYVVALMTDAERDACALAVAVGADALCADVAVSDALVAFFRRRAAHQRFRAAEWARYGLRERMLGGAA